MALSSRFLLLNALLLLAFASSFQPLSSRGPSAISIPIRTSLHVVDQHQQPQQEQEEEEEHAEETTKKYGLEAGLFQSLKQNDGGESAKSLLKKYGIAYLATSIPLALVSFGICYLLVDNGVDIGGLLSKVGIESSGAADKAGTFAIAYAAHKLLSPIRFPPTVVLTPIVAKILFDEPTGVKSEEKQDE